MENFYKVKLRSQITNIVVAFDVVPDISETRNVEYKQFNPIHAPGTIYSYSHTASRIIAVNNARLISRTPREASLNIARLNILRSWTMPYFGQESGNFGTGERGTQSNLIGSPPDVLSLYAFARGPLSNNQMGMDTDSGSQNVPTQDFAERNGRATNFHNIPTVINNLQITYPSDVDYVPTEEATFKFGGGQIAIDIKAGEPVPTIMAVDIQLWETHSPSEFNKFNLADFRAGTLNTF